MTKPTLCLDFDGVLHSYTSGWQGADVAADPPVEGAIEFLCSALEHFDVCIVSSRSHQPNGTNAMRTWLRKYGAPVDRVTFPDHKPAAFVTIDDRAIQFDGKWPAIDVLKAFKPWNKR